MTALFVKETFGNPVARRVKPQEAQTFVCSSYNHIFGLKIAVRIVCKIVIRASCGPS